MTGAPGRNGDDGAMGAPGKVERSSWSSLVYTRHPVASHGIRGCLGRVCVSPGKLASTL